MIAGEFFRRLQYRLNGRVVHLHPTGKMRGNVLLSYTTLPFLNPNETILDAHTNRWESMEIARQFLERGYAVDVIDFENKTFVPKKAYRYFVDLGDNLERLAPLLPPDCIKILHLTGSYWKFQNEAEQARILALKKRRGVTIAPRRMVPETHAIEIADAITMLGNDHTESTYAFAHKKIVRIPLSTTHIYPSPEDKDFEKVRHNFIWFGGVGAVHKGLDLVLEAFAQMPEMHLMICGKLDKEVDFLSVYERELALPNITLTGFVDPGSTVFKDICAETLALVYPSCSEGQAGSVVLTMHAGIIPIVSRESGVDTEDFGIALAENSIEEIVRTVREISSLPKDTLYARATGAWEYAREHHTRERFKEAYGAFVDTLEQRTENNHDNH